MTQIVQRPLVYLESSFVSNLTGRWSPKESTRTKQAASRAWWDLMKDRVTPVVSYVVWEEILDGDENCAVERAGTIRGMPSWKACPESDELAARLIRANAIPEGQEDDARHVAVAAVGGADLLITWNCRHINNPVNLPKTVQIVSEAGYRCPAIADPGQLLAQMEDEP